MKKIKSMIRKEWAEVFKNRFVVFTVAFLPVLFTALPLIILYTARSSGGVEDLGFGEAAPQLAGLCQGLTNSECSQYLLVSQFLLMFMLMPAIIPITFAAYSIVGEKATRTLEPLLATPISTTELLAGKALAACIPAIAATWGGYGIYAIGARLMGVPPAVIAKFFDITWLIAIFVAGPLVAIGGVSVAVMVSSRTNDPRVAEQISAVFIVPIIGLIVAQTGGFILISESFIFWMIVVLVLVDVGLLAFATQLFQRETILTRWK